jgi:hypothetical protein
MCTKKTCIDKHNYKEYLDSRTIIIVVILSLVAFFLLAMIIGLIIFFRHRRYRTAKLRIVSHRLPVGPPPLPVHQHTIASSQITSSHVHIQPQIQHHHHIPPPPPPCIATDNMSVSRAAFMTDLTGGRVLQPNTTYLIRAKV